MGAFERLTRDVDNFPTISDVASRLIQRLDDPECDLGAVAELVSRDGVLAGRIIKLARSPCFGGGMEGESIHHAIARLGIAQTRNLDSAQTTPFAGTGWSLARSGALDGRAHPTVLEAGKPRLGR